MRFGLGRPPLVVCVAGETDLVGGHRRLASDLIHRTSKLVGVFRWWTGPASLAEGLIHHWSPAKSDPARIILAARVTPSHGSRHRGNCSVHGRKTEETTKHTKHTKGEAQWNSAVFRDSSTHQSLSILFGVLFPVYFVCFVVILVSAP